MPSNFQISTLTLATMILNPFGLQLTHPDAGGLLSPLNLGVRDKSLPTLKKLVVSLPSAVTAKMLNTELNEIEEMVDLLPISYFTLTSILLLISQSPILQIKGHFVSLPNPQFYTVQSLSHLYSIQ